MVRTYEISGTPERIQGQHAKCAACKGKKNACDELIKCSRVECGKHFHVACVPDERKLSDEEYAELEYFYCSQKCDDEDAPARQAPAAPQSTTQLLEYIKKLEADMEKDRIQAKFDLEKMNHDKAKLVDVGNSLNARLQAMEDENKRLQADITNLSMHQLPSSTIAGASSIAFQTALNNNLNPFEKAAPGAAQLDVSMQNLLERNRLSFIEPLPARPKELPSFSNRNLSVEEVGQAHAHASIMLSLSERRRQLPKLPEFSGKGSEWLHFRNSYEDLRLQGEYTEKEMNAKLAQALKGEALTYSRLWLYSANPCPDKIMRDLEQRFFSKLAVVTDALNVVHEIPNIKRKDRNELELLKRAVDGFITVCHDVQEDARLHIHIPEEVGDKLPEDLLEKWTKNERHQLIKGNWIDFSHFLNESTSDLKIRVCDRVKSKAKEKEDPKPQKGNSKITVGATQQASSNSTNHSSSAGNSSRGRQNKGQSNQLNPHASTYIPLIGDCPPCDYDNCGLVLYRCKHFRTRPYDVKRVHVDHFKYCSRCLRKGHAAIACPNIGRLPKCRIPGCTDISNHTSVMHPPDCDATRALGTYQLKEATSSLFQMIPVLIEDVKGNQIRVLAFIDTGSNATLMTGDLYRRLGFKGKPYDLKASWCSAGVEENSKRSRKVELKLSALHAPTIKHKLRNVISMDNLELPYQEQRRSEIFNLFPHLKGIEIPEFERQRPQILLGLHHRHLTVPEETVLPPEHRTSAIAERSKLGWAISCANLSCYNLNTIQAKATQDVAQEIEPIDRSKSVTLEDLHKLVQSFMDQDQTSGVYRDKRFLTAQEERSLDVLNKTLRLVEGRYEVGLLWRSDEVELPDNFSTALSRLKSTEATLRKRNLVDWANEHHKLLIDSKFAREATAEELNPIVPHRRVNYVIGFPVVNMNKVPPKPRWVVDTACTHEGVSLNSALLKGPDNLIPLTQALFHFRERKIATAADVQKQFHQVNIIKDDLQCQRYLWRECEPTRPPKIFVHTAMLFGPTDSPAKANAVRITHAKNCASTHPAASRAALFSMYMDDQFNSENSLEEAWHAARQSIDMFAQISWKLVDFRSNSNELLAKLPQAHVNENVLVELSKEDPSLYCCKVLGIYWNPTCDTFQFQQTAENELRRKSIEEDYHPTKREILGFVMRIFDCLGLISHFIIHGKIILQKIWKEQTEWDVQISEEIFKAWKLWLSLFDDIARLKIPRHYGYSSEVKSTDLHIFCDASAEAYAAVAFFRFTFNDENVHVHQVMAKCRVAPKRQLSIPKLELDGAVVGVRLGKIIMDQHPRMKINSTVLWSDSEITLRRIRGVHIKLEPYAAPRIHEIRDTFPISCWRHVPSALNPADDGTKPNVSDYSDHTHRWYTGPDFLKLEKDEWPKEKNSVKEPEHIETLVNVTNLAADAKRSQYYAGIFEDVSPTTRNNWDKYRKVIAITIRVAHNMLKRLDSSEGNHSKVIQPHELEHAENLIFRRIQRNYWPEETSLLTAGRPLRKRHSQQLRSLNPFVHSDGLIRVKTRMAKEENLPFDTRFPIILPNNHETINSIVRHAHEANHHICLEAVIGRLRSKYWIIGVRKAIKRVVAACLFCIEQRKRPYNIPMGELPSVRITATSKPFEHVGADCFGPFTIYCGESYVQKEINVVLFVCLTSHAIFLRRLNRMTSEEIFVGIQELWTRRGPISTIRSDNGTNFKGCANIIDDPLRQRLSIKFGIKWIFNPVYTPQWGGAWERLIKDVKRAMKHALSNVRVNERVFDSILYQVEDIVNSRPLTHVPATPDDDVPITPNLLVKLHPGFSFVTSSPTPNPEKAKNVLEKAHQYSQKVMERWAKEHLPTITRHQEKSGPKRDIRLNDFVVYLNPRIHPSKWERGLVIKTYPGRDGHARLADVKFRSGTVEEKISAYRLALIDIADKRFEMVPSKEATIDSVCAFLENSSNNFAFRRHGNLPREPGDLRAGTPKPGKKVGELEEPPANLGEKTGTPFRAKNKQFHASSAIFINMLNIKANEASKYAKLNRGRVMELGKQLHKAAFINSRLINENSSAKGLALFETAEKSSYQDPRGVYSVKFESFEGAPSFFDMLISLASLDVEVKWLTIDDTSQRSPIVAFAMLSSRADVRKLINVGQVHLLNGRLQVSIPTTTGCMPINNRKYEHAIIRWWPIGEKDWKIILSRKCETSPVSSDGLPKAAECFGREWKNRFLNYIYTEEPYLHWQDIRVEDSAYTTAHVKCYAIHDVGTSNGARDDRPRPERVEQDIDEVTVENDVGIQVEIPTRTIGTQARLDPPKRKLDDVQATTAAPAKLVKSVEPPPEDTLLLNLDEDELLKDPSPDC